MKGLGAEVQGLDFSEASIKIARERNKGIRFHVRDMLEDYADLGLFDGIAALASLIHIPNERLEGALARMADALKPGGYALIVVLPDEAEIWKNYLFRRL